MNQIHGTSNHTQELNPEPPKAGLESGIVGLNRKPLASLDGLAQRLGRSRSRGDSPATCSTGSTLRQASEPFRRGRNIGSTSEKISQPQTQTTRETSRLREKSYRRKTTDTNVLDNVKSENAVSSDALEKRPKNPYPCFNDVLIRLAILLKEIYVDKMNGRIYSRDGTEIPQRKANGHMIINFPGLGGKVTVKVHRVVYISAHMEEVLPCGYDVHHIDKNPLNNCILNLEALPKEVHSRKETIQKLMRNSQKYAKLTGAVWSRCNVTTDLVLALRVCIRHSGLIANRKKGRVYEYFCEKMCIRKSYAMHLADGYCGNNFAGKPTPADIEHYLKEYDWLLTAAKNGDTYEQIKQRFPEKFDENQATETNSTT